MLIYVPLGKGWAVPFWVLQNALHLWFGKMDTTT